MDFENFWIKCRLFALASSFELVWDGKKQFSFSLQFLHRFCSLNFQCTLESLIIVSRRLPILRKFSTQHFCIRAKSNFKHFFTIMQLFIVSLFLQISKIREINVIVLKNLEVQLDSPKKNRFL